MLRKAAVPKRICDRRRAQNAISISVQGQHASKRDNFPIFCVILNQRTSSTLHSSALKMGEFSPLEVRRVRNRSDDASARHLNEVYWPYTD